MKYFVVDTNVPIVANAKNDEASPSCVVACIRILEQITHNGILLLDNLGLIFDEYKRYLNFNGEPGVGDAFLKWVFENMAVSNLCLQISITTIDVDPPNFLEFPQADGFRGFDRNDRKFVAVAYSSQLTPTIVNAVDPDWLECKESFEEIGLVIQSLC